MNPCGMIFEVHETVKHELRTFIIREWAVPARAEIDDPGQSDPPANACCRVMAARFCQDILNIGEAGIGVGIDIQAVRQRLSLPI